MDRSEIWDRIVARENLHPIPLKAFLGESHHYVDMLLRIDARAIGRPNLLSTIKIRQAGFTDCIDSLESVGNWINEMRERQLIPKGP